MFQFHKGSINTPSPLTDNEELLSFNSIKVRLIHFNEDANPKKLVFQFHKGSINTQTVTTPQTIHHQFQFHKGSINTQERWSHHHSQQQFQFHKGSINTNES